MNVEHLWFSTKLQGQQESRNHHKSEVVTTNPGQASAQSLPCSGVEGSGRKSLKEKERKCVRMK